MITVLDIKEIVDRRGLGVLFSPGERDPARADQFWLGEFPLRYLVHFDVRHANFYLGNSLMSRRHPWDDWFRFDETDISLRGINVDWWRRYKPALQDMAKLIESKFPGPVGCRPDICSQ